MKRFFKKLIDEVLNSQKIVFSLQEILQDKSTRVIGFIALDFAPVQGTVFCIENTNAKGEKYFKNYVVDYSTIVMFENGKKEGFLYLKFFGIQHTV
mgnify:CR=1 FL=1